MYVFVFFFKQKTAYEMRISDWSSDVCSSDLAVVLAIDGARERISLGVKQVNQDPMSEFLATNTKGEMVKGVAKTVDARGAVIDLGNGIEGYIKAADLSRDRVEDATKVLKEGDELESRFIGVEIGRAHV